MSVIKNQIITEFSSIDKNTAMTAKALSKAHMDLEKRVIATRTGFFKQNVELEKQVRIGKKWYTTSKTMTSGMQGFRMELLSTMFFGMGIAAMFTGWLQPAMDAFGVFDLFNTMLMVTFIPIMELIFPILLGIMEAFMGLPEPIQLLIGAIAVVGAVVGTALAAFGALGLGLAGLATAFGTSGAAATAGGASIGAGFMAALAPVLPIILAVGAAIAIFTVLWTTNLFGFRDKVTAIFGVIISSLQFLWSVWSKIFGIVANVVIAAWNIISIPFKFIWGFLEGLTEKTSIFSVAWQAMCDAVVSAIKIVWPVLEPIVNAMKWIFDNVGSIAGGIAAAAANAGNNAYSAGKSLGSTSTPKFAQGGVVPGRLGEPMPIIAHGGERFLGTGGSGTSTAPIVYYNPTYNIEVADKAQIENLIKKNNETFVRDLRRLTFGG